MMNNIHKELAMLKPYDKNVEALTDLTAAYLDDPKNPETNFQMAYQNLRIGDLDASKMWLQRFLDLSPKALSDYDWVRVENMYGMYHRYEGWIDASSRHFQKTYDYDIMSQLNYGFNRLMQGFYTEGFAEYEKRWQAYGHINPLEGNYHQLQKGEKVPEKKSLYVLTEGGLGDVIQMARFIPHAGHLNGHIYFHVPDTLYYLMDQAFSSSRHIKVLNDKLATLIKKEYIGGALNLGSLPHYLNIDNPRLYTIRSSYNYIGGWSKRKVENRRPRVGINWGGNPQHETDFTRSIPTERIQELLDLVPEVEWVSIHMGAYERESPLPSVVENNRNYYDTYKAFLDLDYVVSVDTSTIHLAGSMDIPSTVMVSKVPEWRWGLEGSESAWYPSVKIARQQEINDWSKVFEETALNIVTYFKNKQNEISLEDLPF